MDDYLKDADTGHRIVGTLYVQSNTMTRTHGPEHLRSIGETEFAASVAEESDRTDGGIKRRGGYHRLDRSIFRSANSRLA